MPFCTQCGKEVRATDTFCGSCGYQQAPGPSASAAEGAAPGAKTTPPKNPVGDFVQTVNPHTAAICCYIPLVGWIASIVILAAEKFRHDKELRFHAFQGLYIFVLWLFVDWVFTPMAAFAASTRFIGHAMHVVVFGVWIFMLVKTSQGELFRLPIIGELADRSVSEQK